MRKLLFKVLLLLLFIFSLFSLGIYFLFTNKEKLPKIKKEKPVSQVYEPKVEIKKTEQHTLPILNFDREIQELKEVRGIVPSKPKSAIGWKGHYFANMKEFRKSPIYDQFLAERNEREKLKFMEEEENQKQYNRSLDIIRKYRKMSEVDVAREESLRRGRELMK